MACKKCGCELDDNAEFCPRCGVEVEDFLTDEEEKRNENELLEEDTIVEKNDENKDEFLEDFVKEDNKFEDFIIDVTDRLDVIDDEESLDETSQIDIVDIFESDTSNKDIDSKENDFDSKVEDLVSDFDDEFLEKEDTSLVEEKTDMANFDIDIFGTDTNKNNEVDTIKETKTSDEGKLEEKNTNSSSIKNNIFNNKNIIFLLGNIICLVLLAILIFIFTSKNECVLNPESNGECNTSKNDIVYFKDYSLEIPNNYQYGEKDGALLIGEDQKWAAQIEVANGKYTNLEKKASELKSVLSKKNYSSTQAEKKKINKIDMITMEVKADNQNVLLALTDGNSSNYFVISIINKDNNIDYEILDKVVDIIKTKNNNSGNNKIMNFKNSFSKEFDSIAK